MLLGAPVVISLMAGIAIPVIIVGIPIYMGRKVSEKYTECEFLFYHVKDFYSQKTKFFGNLLPNDEYSCLSGPPFPHVCLNARIGEHE